MHPVHKANDRLTGIALVALSLALLFITFAAVPQSRCRLGNKVCCCDTPTFDGTVRLDSTPFRGIPVGLAAQFATGVAHKEVPTVPAPERAIPHHGASASVEVLALAPKTSPPVLCA